MTKQLPRVKADDVVRVARKLGFQFDRQSGSHAVYFRPADKRRFVVPIHAGRILKPKTLGGIIKDMGIEVGDFRKLL
jgi:predicted RNA binding protein YcfA (HicA-like mRNA interferase family)